MVDKKYLLGALTLVGLGWLAFGRKAGAENPDIVLSDLTITPLSVMPGDEVLIGVTATDMGNSGGSKLITVDVTGMTTLKKTVYVNPGESMVQEFSVKPSVPGVYEVTVDGLSGSFTVEEEAIADIQLSNLVISPEVVHPGDTVTIKVTATNYGNTAGEREIIFTVA